MRPRISVVTLGVDDLQRATRFYRDGLGLPLEGIFGSDEERTTVAFFALEGRQILALYPRAWLAADAGLELSRGGGAVSLGHNVGSRAEVDALLARARAAGAAAPEPPRERAWGGYSGYFRDPDGHLWEVVWNPAMPEL